MSDVALHWDPDSLSADLAIEANDLARDEGLETAVLLSLLTDRRAADDDVVPVSQAVPEQSALVPGSRRRTVRRNLLLWSQEFDNAVWARNTGVTVSANADTAPDGTVTADQLVYNGTGSVSDWRIYEGIDTAPVGTTRTLSVWMRSASPVTLRLYLNGGLNATICSVTSSWQRFTLTTTFPSALSCQFNIYSASGDNAAFTVSLWGAQVEAGDVPTDYIASGASPGAEETYGPTTAVAKAGKAVADRRGWWADALPVVTGDLIGSRLWLLSREKDMAIVRDRAEEYAREALQWLLDDRVAERVEVTPSVPRPGMLGLTIQIYRPGRPDPVQYHFTDIWAAQGA